jgi:maltose alpha-D-glucosyltransferase/alpha-amylase
VVASFQVEKEWTELWTGSSQKNFSRQLGTWVARRRWFRAKSDLEVEGRLIDILSTPGHKGQALIIYEAEFVETSAQRYFVPVALVSGADLEGVEHHQAQAVIVYVEGLGTRSAVVDSVATAQGAEWLLSLFQSPIGARGAGGTLGSVHPNLKAMLKAGIPAAKPAVFEQTNSTILFGEQLLLKVYRQMELGTNSELAIGEFLAKGSQAAPVPDVLGSLRVRPEGSQEDAALALIQRFVPNEGTAWDFVRIRSHPELFAPEPRPQGLVARAKLEPEQLAWDLIGSFLSSAKKLGQRTGEVHVALARKNSPAEFAPESFSLMVQQSIFQWTRASLTRTFAALRTRLKQLPPAVAEETAEMLKREAEIESILQGITKVELGGQRIRCHGDLHLGQVLHTGDDFVLIDFEGEPDRSLSERSHKRCPLRDVTGMLRSFNYATESALRSGRYRERDTEKLKPWARYFEEQVSAQYLRGYFDETLGHALLPEDDEQLELLLRFFTIEKAIYEVGYEMNNRPQWLPIPLAGLKQILERG